jgi:Bacterial Ig-like domain (group 2)/Galactose oxidase, central domain
LNFPLVAVAAAVTLLAGCNCGGTTVTVTSVAITPATPTVSSGSTLQLHATLTLSDGTHPDATAKGQWAVSDTSLATISNDAGTEGLVTGRTGGSTQVHFTYVDPSNASSQVTDQVPLTITSVAGATGHWTWMGGASTPGAAGVYGTLGVGDAANVPGARMGEPAWTARDGGLVLCSGAQGYFFDDRWTFDGTSWTWVGGPQGTVDLAPVYGVRGSPAASNDPGARTLTSTWTDAAGNLWLFGGSVDDGQGHPSSRNDLWKFDGTSWTWVSGSNTPNAPGVYGTKGVADPGNVPGARAAAASWVDGNGNLWLFGGAPPFTSGSTDVLNDLWRFDGASWTWMGGSSVKDDNGVYGTKGTPSPNNIPAARAAPAVWVDSSHQVWLFGGEGTGGAAYDDLWKFDGTSWTWVGGSYGVGTTGPVFGTRGVPAPGNSPPPRSNALAWTDRSGGLWLFGGLTGPRVGWSGGYSNDLWRFDGTAWAWMSGARTPGQAAVYGTLGTAGPDTVPGARFGSAAWVDPAGNLWLFGGELYTDVNSVSAWTYYNDVWRYEP